MSIKELKNLSKLKEQGIILNKEFEREKKKILSKNTINVNKSRFNVRNFVLSFVIAITQCLIVFGISIVIGFVSNVTTFVGVSIISTILNAIIVLIISLKIEASKYKNTINPILLCVIILLFGLIGGLIGVWISMYEFLQINDGLKEIK